jgi:hypothetical protein
MPSGWRKCRRQILHRLSRGRGNAPVSSPEGRVACGGLQPACNGAAHETATRCAQIVDEQHFANRPRQTADAAVGKVMLI